MKPQPENLEPYITAIRAEQKASTSWLREKFSIGYGKADRIMRALEKQGVVSKASKTGARKILEPEKPAKLDCAESGIVLRREAGGALIEQIKKEYADFCEASNALGKNAISAANLARAVGLHLQTLNKGHKQIDLHFWSEQCEDVLPFDFDTGKMFVSVANKMEHPAKTVTEAVQFVQMALVANGTLEIAERTESQGRSTVSVMEKFFSSLTLMQVPWKKIVNERPMEQWDKKSIETFLYETEWISTERDRAAKLQGQKYREI